MSVGAGGTTDAYVACEQITRTQARNFYYGIRLLPAEKRSVLCAVYALARRVDDLGDGDLPVQAKRDALHALRAEVERGDSADPVVAAVHDGARRFPIPLGAFGELIDGMELDLLMDAEGRRYQSFEDLVVYCRCVAGSIGRLCLGVFGSRHDPQAAHYADSLGIALQQTNILRDVREDLVNGRVYLPQEDLERFGVRLVLDDEGRLADPDGHLGQLIRASAARADAWYEVGMRLVPLLDHRSAASARAMAGIYRRLLDQIATRPALVYDRRLSLSGWQKAGVAARALSGLGA